MLTPEEQAEYEALRAKAQAQGGAPGDPMWRNVARLAGQGLSFGTGDELVAGGVAGIRKLTGDERPFLDIYRDVHDMESQAMHQFRDTHPGTAFAAEAGGALLTAPVAAARGLQAASALAPRAMSRVPRFVAPVGAGAVEGSIYGAAAAERGERLPGAATGSALGAGLGAGAGLAQKALQKPLGWVWRQMTSAPTSDAQRVTLQALADAGYTADDVRRALDELGPDARLADLGGEMGALGDVAAASPGGGKYVAQLAQRHRQQVKEVTRAFEETARMRPNRRATRSALRQVADEARREVQPIYANLYGAGVRETPALMQMLTHPGMRPIFRRARRISELDDMLNRRNAPKFDLSWERLARGIHQGPVRIEHVDYIQRALREAAGDMKGGPARSRGLAYSDIRDGILREVDPDFPEFARARRIWSGRKRIEEAADMGRRFNSLRPEQFDAFVEDVPRAEKEAFLMGVHDYIRTRLGRIRRGRDISTATEFDTPEFERRMSLLLGPNAANNLMARLENVRRKAITYGRTRNSTTFPRQAMERKLRDESGGEQLVSDLMTGNVVGAGARMLRDTLTRESLDPMMLDELARLTLSQGGANGLNLGALPGSLPTSPMGHMVRGPATAAAVGHATHNTFRDPRYAPR